MGANRPALWMVVDLEEEELPLYVARNAQDVADWAGTSRESVMSSISHARERDGKSKFVRIYLDDDDEILQMEREGKLIGTKEIADYIGIAGTTIAVSFTPPQEMNSFGNANATAAHARIAIPNPCPLRTDTNLFSAIFM